MYARTEGPGQGHDLGHPRGTIRRATNRMTVPQATDSRARTPAPFVIKIFHTERGGVSASLTQGAVRGPHCAGEQVGLFPGGKVAAPVEPVVVNEVAGIGALGPAPRGLIELVGE